MPSNSSSATVRRLPTIFTHPPLFFPFGLFYLFIFVTPPLWLNDRRHIRILRGQRWGGHYFIAPTRCEERIFHPSFFYSLTAAAVFDCTFQEWKTDTRRCLKRGEKMHLSVQHFNGPHITRDAPSVLWKPSTNPDEGNQ